MVGYMVFNHSSHQHGQFQKKNKKKNNAAGMHFYGVNWPLGLIKKQTHLRIFHPALAKHTPDT